MTFMEIDIGEARWRVSSEVSSNSDMIELLREAARRLALAYGGVIFEPQEKNRSIWHLFLLGSHGNFINSGGCGELSVFH